MSKTMYLVAMPIVNPYANDKANLTRDRQIIHREIDGRHDSYTKGIEPMDYAFIEYTDIPNLATQANDHLPPGFVVDVLEIHAHGSPGGCGGITADSISADGQSLMTIRWDDDADFYLSGCNTGTWEKFDKTEQSIAKKLAKAMWIDTLVTKNNEKFHHKLDIWGSAGYFLSWTTGLHMDLGTNQVKAQDPDGNDGAEYGGAKDATGKDCWYKNPNHP